MCGMPRVEWWERDIRDLIDEVDEDGAVHDTLTQSGLLNFFQIPLMCSTNLLMSKLVIFWDRDVECSTKQGERLEITL